ncbi:MAG: response regulator [Oscillatoriophycideae cyanobacterium NC_groundwater_1537_Pr4_S-0.65um_50_18]|nr:response regulator [Oscillatoriophycideae cyanobacterium NC_groundwater_1537_Pr4_S-0.65um_50_18]
MCHILIVDDIQDNTFWLQTLLESEGYRINTASGGWEALEEVEALKPDIVLLDVLMPDMVGYSVAERIRRNPAVSKIGIILMTASSVLNQDEAMNTGADAFFRKPIDSDQLLSALKTLCEQVKNR